MPVYTNPLPVRLDPNKDYRFRDFAEEKIDYSSYEKLKDESLFLDDFYFNVLKPLLSIPKKQKHAQDSMKVVDCCRFILLNECFIRYAYDHQDDDRIYTFTNDKESHVLRDFNRTSFHLFTADDKNADKTADYCIENLNSLIKAFIKAIEIASSRNKMSEFIDKLYYDEAVGCLEARLRPAITYARELQKRKLSRFEESFKPLYEQFGDDTLENYRLVFEKLLQHYGETFLVGEKEEVITEKFLISYMQNQGQELTAEELKQLYAARKLEAQDTLELIKKEKALIKVISASYKDATDLNFILNQLVDPANCRPVKRLESGINRAWYWDPRPHQPGYNGKFQPRSVNSVRGASKPAGWKFTKKTAMSLLPPDGRMYVYQQSNHPTIFIFNVEECHLKDEKYVFETNAKTDSRWWLYGSDTNSVNSISLEDLRRKLRYNISVGNIPYHNEILACLTRNVRGIGIAKDILSDRLNQIRVKYILKGSLGHDIPILFLTGRETPTVYTLENQVEDMIRAKYFEFGAEPILAAITQDFAKFICENYPDLKLSRFPASYLKRFVQTLLDGGRIREAFKYIDSIIPILNVPEFQETKDKLLWHATLLKDKDIAKKALTIGGNPSYCYLSKDSSFMIAIKTDQSDLVSEMLKYPLVPKDIKEALEHTKKINADLELNLFKQLLESINCYEAIQYTIDTKSEYLIQKLKIQILNNKLTFQPHQIANMIIALIKIYEYASALTIFVDHIEIFQKNAPHESLDRLLICAATEKQYYLIKLILEMSVNLNYQKSCTDDTLLLISLKKNVAELTDYLLSQPEKLSSTSLQQALLFAAEEHRLDLAKRLPNIHNQYANPKTKEYCLHYAIRNSDTAMIIESCQRGSDINETNIDSESALDLTLKATVDNQQEMLFSLVEHTHFDKASFHNTLLKLIKKNEASAAVHLLKSQPIMAVELTPLVAMSALNAAADKGMAALLKTLLKLDLPWSRYPNELLAVAAKINKTIKPGDDFNDIAALLEEKLKIASLDELSIYRKQRDSEWQQQVHSGKNSNRAQYNSFFGKYFGYSATEKLNAVTKLQEKLSGENDIEFTSRELSALNSNRLGKIISKYKFVTTQLKNPPAANHQIRRDRFII